MSTVSCLIHCQSFQQQHQQQQHDIFIHVSNCQTSSPWVITSFTSLSLTFLLSRSTVYQFYFSRKVFKKNSRINLLLNARLGMELDFITKQDIFICALARECVCVCVCIDSLMYCHQITLSTIVNIIFEK